MTEIEIKKEYERLLKIFNGDEKRMMEEIKKIIKFQKEK